MSTVRELITIVETHEKGELYLAKLPYKKDALAPVMSEDTINYHYGKLARGYVDRYNKGEGDSYFNEAGAFLHNIFFPQLITPKGSNKPTEASADLINKKYTNFNNFKKEFTETAMLIQGSGWVYMSRTGDIKTIKNHAIKHDIALLVDWWEHAWALDYQADKSKYLNNIWRCINWDVVNQRL
jgi:Fe-Mn family superoxide dismutase